MEKIKLIKNLAESLKLTLPEWINEKHTGMKVHLKDSKDEDPIIAPWIYLEDIAITVEDDGRYKILDFHNEEHPIYFDDEIKLLNYIKGYYDGFGVLDKEAQTKEYAIGYAKCINEALKYLYEI